MTQPLNLYPIPRLATGLSAGLLGLPPGGFLSGGAFQEVITNGSTDGILLAGFILLLIIIIPIAWARRRWNR